MALSGDLKDFGLVQLLTLVRVTNKTGALTLKRSDETATIYFQDGRLTRVKVPDSRSDDLGTALYRAGRIDREQHELIDSQASPSEKLVGLLLADQGILSQEEIVDFVRERSLADLFSLLTWPDGIFRFDTDATPSEDEIIAPTDLGPVLDKATSYMQEWQRLTSYVPDLGHALRLRLEPKEPMDEIRLSPPEWKLVVALTREVPLREVAKDLGLDDVTTRRLAYQLISSGLADISAAAEPSAPPAETPKEAPPPQQQQRRGAISRLFGPRPS